MLYSGLRSVDGVAPKRPAPAKNGDPFGFSAVRSTSGGMKSTPKNGLPTPWPSSWFFDVL
jgi:hypothetical protein